MISVHLNIPTNRIGIELLGNLGIINQHPVYEKNLALGSIGIKDIVPVSGTF
jgi:hypothetical protein